MRSEKPIRIACATVVAMVIAAATSGAAQGQSAAAASAAKASPELVGMLSQELGSSPEQAAGAAGALFGVAKSKLSAEDFAQVASAVPGMSSLLGAAPKTPAAVGTAGALSQLAGSAGGGLAGVASAFSGLGLKPELVAKAIPVLTSFVSKSGGAGVGNLLAGALK
jgi:hypothetical protein